MEPSLTIRLDVGNDGVFDLTTTTNSSGFYSFNIPATPSGAYRVAQFPPITRISTTGPTLVVLPNGEVKDDAHFGSYLVAAITGTAFDDLNGNGALDGGEPGLDGVTITVGGPPPAFTQITSGGGLYTFQIDGSGAFFVRQVAPAGRIETTSEPQLVVLGAGDQESDVNFGSFDPISISGQAFDDLDGDGVKDPGEPGLPGVTIQLDLDANGSVDQTTTTNGSGNYTFPGLSPGTYRVRQVAPPGRTQTTANPADIAVPPDASGVDFGSFDPISISGQAFDDLDGDGIKDPGEPGLDGVTIQLDAGADGSVNVTATTSGGGLYSFANLGPGTYRVR